MHLFSCYKPVFYVTRYYNSWFETSDEPADSDSSSCFSETPKTSESEKKVSLPTNFKKNSLDQLDNVEANAPKENSLSAEFSISYEPSRSRSQCYQGDLEDSDSSDEELNDEEDVFALSFM